MNISDNFSLNPKGETISIVGAGGKTTTMFSLSSELKEKNKKVLITTTTAIYNPENGYDYYFLGDIEEDFIPKAGSITVLGNNVENGKLKGVSPELIDRINKKNLFDFILIEADGSKGKPIKAPRENEPVIAKSTTKTIGIIGIDSIGKVVNRENVNRIEYFCNISGKDEGDKIEAVDVVSLTLDPNGLFKNSCGEKILLLNKCKGENLPQIRWIRERLKQEGFKNTIAADIKTKVFY